MNLLLWNANLHLFPCTCSIIDKICSGIIKLVYASRLNWKSVYIEEIHDHAFTCQWHWEKAWQTDDGKLIPMCIPAFADYTKFKGEICYFKSFFSFICNVFQKLSAEEISKVIFIRETDEIILFPFTHKISKHIKNMY